MPFQTIVPSKSISMSITSGCTGGGGALVGRGMSSFTACVITGMVMMNMMSNTSMTSMSGVVLMSHIAPSLLLPTLIAMVGSP